jgi:hypothetical protein
MRSMNDPFTMAQKQSPLTQHFNDLAMYQSIRECPFLLVSYRDKIDNQHIKHHFIIDAKKNVREISLTSRITKTLGCYTS